MRQRLEKEHGGATFEAHDGSERLDELLAEGFHVEGSGWKLAQGTAIVSQPETQRFYTDVARWAAGRGLLRLLFLRVEGRPIAFEFGIEDGDRYYSVKGGYDPDFRKHSPGMVMSHDMIRRAADLGLETFEYLGAPDPEKLEWTDTLRDRTAVEAFAPAPLGRLARASYVHGRPLAKRGVAALRRAGRPGAHDAA
jgi:CelD/BcsL family acetyltransferase involved in cellulose biosynthesis